MKRITLVLALALLASVFPTFKGAQAASSGQQTVGFVEEVGAAGYVKGWLYNNDQPVTVVFSFVSVANPSDTRYYSITNQQVSNKIALFSQRNDVQSYLKTKYGVTSFHYPQGFFLRVPFLPVGQWRLSQVTVQSIWGETLPIISSNETVTITETDPYQEGYVDITSGPIQGWAYASNNNRPEIRIKLSKDGGVEQKEFVLPQNVDHSGPMSRTRREDVNTFLVGQRGQSRQFDAAWDLGFILNSRQQGLLSSGYWHIDSIQANGITIPYGNTNATDNFYISQ